MERSECAERTAAALLQFVEVVSQRVAANEASGWGEEIAALPGVDDALIRLTMQLL